MKQALQFIGSVSSIVGVPLVLWVWFTITQEIKVSRLESEKTAEQQYVAKSEYTEAVKAINATLDKLADLQQQDRLNLQHLADVVQTRKDKTN